MASTAVFGMYPTELQVEMAVGVMKREGFRNTDISILFPENEGTRDFALSKSMNVPEVSDGVTSAVEMTGAFAWLSGVAELTIPGAGPFVAAGPLIGALRGVRGSAGGLAGALAGIGIPEDEAARQEERIQSGHILMSVHTDHRAWIEKAKAVFEKTGAGNVTSTADASRDYEYSNSPKLLTVVTW